MNQRFDTSGLCRLGNIFRGQNMHVHEAARAAFIQNTDQVDHRISTVNSTTNRFRVFYIAMNRNHLAQIAHRLEFFRPLKKASRYTYGITGFQQALDDIAPDKAATAKYSDDTTIHFKFSPRRPLSGPH